MSVESDFPFNPRRLCDVDVSEDGVGAQHDGGDDGGRDANTEPTVLA